MPSDEVLCKVFLVAGSITAIVLFILPLAILLPKSGKVEEVDATKQPEWGEWEAWQGCQDGQEMRQM